MASTPDSPTENNSVPTDVPAYESPDVLARLESERRKEVPALLGTAEIPDPTEQAPGVEPEVAADATDSGSEPPSEPDHTPEPLPAEAPTVAAIDVALLLEPLQDSLAATRYISAKIDSVSEDTGSLLQRVSTLSNSNDQLTAEMEALTSSSTDKKLLSKTFLIAASSLIAVLAVVQIYTFVSLLNTQRLQNAAGSAVLAQMTSLNKKMAQYDSNLAKALEKPVPQEQA
ncbi:MAG: hypothetical protein PHI31_13165, partial [Desulfuromonadaceae bacterium]|nr:hypothetical protein [Desulfuromonadaceae bacterium]